MNGKIIGISSFVIKIQFEDEAPKISSILTTDKEVQMSVESILRNNIVDAVLLSNTDNISIGDQVFTDEEPLQAPVGKRSLGRIFNVFGESIDEKPVDNKIIYRPVNINKRVTKDFVPKSKLIETGIKIIDLFLPILQGDKLGMFGGAGVGKTLVIKEIIRNLSESTKKANNLFVGIGERSREGEELYQELKDSKLIDKVALFFAQMNETPGARMKIIYSALTNAEYFRDELHEDTYMFIDNIYRFSQAGSEVSSSLGKIPSQSGYQPTLISEISSVQERISTTKNGSITAFQTVFVPADDITDPAVVAIFSHLDGSLVLDRKFAAEGKFPAISPLESTSNNLLEDVVGRRHVEIATKSKFYLQRYEELEDLLSVLGSDGLSDEDKIVVVRARMIGNYMTQNFFTAEEFTQRKGDWVTLEQTLSSLESIFSGELDEVDPSNFLYITDTTELLDKIRTTDEEESLEYSKKSLKKMKKQEKSNYKKLKKESMLKDKAKDKAKNKDIEKQTSDTDEILSDGEHDSTELTKENTIDNGGQQEEIMQYVDIENADLPEPIDATSDEFNELEHAANEIENM